MQSQSTGFPSIRIQGRAFFAYAKNGLRNISYFTSRMIVLFYLKKLLRGLNLV